LRVEAQHGGGGFHTVDRYLVFVSGSAPTAEAVARMASRFMVGRTS
jgi:hypothetical protein